MVNAAYNGLKLFFKLIFAGYTRVKGKFPLQSLIAGSHKALWVMYEAIN